MNHYENIAIINADLNEEDTQKAITSITDVIKKDGGLVVKEENWGQKKLAYELNKHKKGTYVYILFQAPSTTVPALEKFYKIYDQVIKFMIVRLSKKEVEAALPKEESSKEKESEMQTSEEKVEGKQEEAVSV